MKTDNKIVVNLKSVQWARFYYQNQHGDKRNTKPVANTVFNQEQDNFAKLYGSTVTMQDHVTQHKLWDRWTPCIVLKLTAHETLKYTGEKAVSLYKAWCETIFNKKEKK